MADVSDLTLTPDELETARAALRDAWRRRGVPAADIPEMARMSGSEIGAQAHAHGNTAAVLEFAERQHTGFLVALWLDADAASQLVVPNGEPAENLHITLCYVPDADGWDELTRARAIAAVDRAVRWRPVIDGKVGGYGRFIASESSDAQDVFYAAVDMPRLNDLRESVELELREAGIQPSDVHGYTPHITLAYLDPEASNPVDRLPDVALAFGAATVMLGERRIDIPLSPDAAIFAIRDDTSDAALHIYQAVAFTEAPEWSPFLPIPGVYHHPIYGELNYTAETYDRIVANFKAGIYQDRLPVNAEHDPQAAGAVGWIVDMRLAGSGAIEVKVEWNERGRKLIEGDRYRYVSAELYPWWVDPVDPERTYQDVAIGMAITTQPYFKERVLPPLAASEAALTYTAGEPGKEGPMPNITPNTPKPPESTKGEEPIIDPAADARQATVQMNEQMLQEFRELKAKHDRTEQELSEVKARNAELHDKALVKEFTDEVRGRSDENGVPWVGDIKAHVEMLTDLAKAFGEKSDQVKRYIATNRAQAEQARTSDLFREFGSSRGGDASGQARIDATVSERMKADASLTREQATTQVLSEHPELYSQYLRDRR